MTQFKVNGKVLPKVEHIRIREFAEAEKALGINADDAGLAGQTAIALYVAMRREDPDIPAGVLADQILDTDMEGIGSVEEEVPLPEAEAEPGPESPPTSGPRRLEASA